MKIFITVVFLLISLLRFNAQAITVKPYVQDGDYNKMTIMWEVDASGNGFVDWGLTPFNLSTTASSTAIVGNGNSRIHAAIINGLSPSSKYYYRTRMASGTISKVYHFITHPLKSSNKSLNFIAVSDMQRDVSNPGVFKSLMENGVATVIDSAFTNGLDDLDGIIIPGDLVQTGGVYASWKSDFFDLCDSLSPYIPIYPVAGNHEYYSGGLPNFLKYFTLPLNGSPANPEEWWYKDISNVRLIGLNSNSPAADLATQLSWIQGVLDDAGNDDDIDFIFVQLHHPFKSELWIPGELNFTGDIITKLEIFSTQYGKPSLHFFGHTHAYSRGASRDHQHLWVNVATAGGAIDNWGEFPNADYEEFTISEDEYGFVLMQVEAGPDPSFRLRRFSRGDQNGVENNTFSDEISIKRYDFGPRKPQGIYPVADSVLTNCVRLKAGKFFDPENTHQASHWQIVESCDFNSALVSNKWKQSTNWYNEINTQANDDLTDEIIPGLLPNKQYCWRVRYRDQFLKWSNWSEPLTFYTKTNQANPSTNLLLNNGAESGISNWTGQIEALTNNECNSVPVFQGLKFFAIGGVCSNEQTVGYATQTIDVNAHATQIDNGTLQVEYQAYMRAYSANNDKPEMFIEFLNAGQNIVSTSTVISNTTGAWLLKTLSQIIPATTRYLRVVLKGTRLAGTDNDSYFDETSLKLYETLCPSCVGSNLITAIDSDGDGFCANIDCDDTNNNKFPGNTEDCDGIDNNCDGMTDSGMTAIWMGNGDGQNWSDGANWSQGFEPLPCQHVTIQSNHTIAINGRAYIKSLQLGINAKLSINQGAELLINGYNPMTSAAANIDGSCTNNGKFIIKNSAQEGLQVGGILNNLTGQMVIQQVNLNGIRILPSGKFENKSNVDIKH